MKLNILGEEIKFKTPKTRIENIIILGDSRNKSNFFFEECFDEFMVYGFENFV